MQTPDWINTGSDFPSKLPKLAFPLTGDMPKIYAPQSTILRISDNQQFHSYLWCYLERRAHGKRYRFNPSSLSARRVKDMPGAIQRLSKRLDFDAARPLTVLESLRLLSRFLYWVDGPLHQARYEAVLSDPDLSLEALQLHHTFLRQLSESNCTEGRISANAASTRDAAAVNLMSVIHDREYGDEIETLKFSRSEGVLAPETEDVAAFLACVQGIFDSVIRIAVEPGARDKKDFILSALQWQSGGQEVSVVISEGTCVERVMELGCMAFAALCVGDSGANLAQIQSYEEPLDMQVQLDNPEKLNLHHKVIKFRAGGNEVPVHLTATTVTRLRSYLHLREALRVMLDSPEISPMYVQCEYAVAASGGPRRIIALARDFTEALRRRFRSFGIELPSLTMQQLRAYKQGKLTKEHNPKVAADMMGTSVSTAIRNYSKITETESRSEVAPFLASLTSVVLARSKADGEGSKTTHPLTPIPPGGCADHGHPKALTDHPLVEPDCKKTEGCFFCDKYRAHADETDTIKLMSCRSVLERLPPRAGDSGAAERVYDAVMNRIGALLTEIKGINPEAHAVAWRAVQEEGRLSRYWASKLQQLHLLGLLAPTSTKPRHSVPGSPSA